jgi:ribose transport system permease protein
MAVTFKRGGRADRHLTVGYVLERAGLPIALAILIVLFGLLPQTSKYFFTPSNINVVTRNQSVTGLIALAMLIPLIAGYFDLSAAAGAGVSSVTVAALIVTYHQSVLVSVIAGIVIGTLIGAVNGILVAGLRLNAFITTFGTYILLSGLLDLYTSGASIFVPINVALWSNGNWLEIARPLWILAIPACIIWFIVRHTPFGRRLTAVGSNEPAARLAGFRVDRAIFLTYVLGGLLAGIAGVLLTSRNGSGDSTSAISYLFPAMAAVFLGQTAINPGYPNVWGTIFAIFFIAVAVDGFSLMGAASWVSLVFNGLALVVAVALSTLIKRSRERAARAAQIAALQELDHAPVAAEGLRNPP